MEEGFTKNGQRYDLILDVVGYHSIFDYRRALGPRGMYRMVEGPTGLIFQALLPALLISKVGGKKMGILAHEPNKDLDFLVALIETGKVTPIIDKHYPLREVAEAIQYLGEGRVKGKVVITM